MAQLQDPSRVRRDDVAMIGPSTTKGARTPEVKEKELAILADLYYRDPSGDHYKLTQRFNEVTGRSLTRSAITKDLAKIRKATVEGMVDDMSIVVAEELLKLNDLEKTVWKMLYDSQDNVKRRIIDKVVRENEDGEMEEIIKTIRVIEEFSGEFALKCIDKITVIQKERRKLYGVYAYSAIEQERTVDVEQKGYVNISPDDWETKKKDREYE